MNLKFLPAILGLSVSLAANSTFASEFIGLFREDEALQAALAASFNDFHDTQDEIKRLAEEEEAFQRALENPLHKALLEAKENLLSQKVPKT